MNQLRMILIALLATGTVNLSACSDDSTSKTNSNEDPIPQHDNPCDSPCTENDRECRDNTIWECKTDDSGCLIWQLVKTCGEGTQCDVPTHTCKANCSITCNPDAPKRCNHNELQKCTADANGCGSWEVLETCEGICNDQTLQCEPTGKNPCNVGDRMCSSQGIVTCEQDGEYTKWSDPVPCGENQECKENPVECVDLCSSECQPGETRVQIAQYQECSDSNAHGCMKWKTVKECNAHEYFNLETNDCTTFEKFSIVFLPDTQKYTRPHSKDDPYILDQQLSWIRDHYQDPELNIKAVMHLGDMTDTNADEAWKMVKDAYNNHLDTINLPYLPATGNHDYMMCKNNNEGCKRAILCDPKLTKDYSCDLCKTDKGDAGPCDIYERDGTQFSSKGGFNNDHFDSLNWPSYAKFGSFYDTGSSYMTMTVSGIKFLLMSLEFAPRKNVLCWAEDIIDKHPDYKVIIEVHGYLTDIADTVKRSTNDESKHRYTSGYTAGASPFDLSEGASGYEIYNELASRHNNIILVAGGHITSNIFRINRGNDDDHWFGEMLIDYEHESAASGTCASTTEKGGAGGGWMRILTFDPDNRTIEAKTITPLADKYFPKNTPQFYCNPDTNNPTSSDPNKYNEAYPNDPALSPDHHLSTDYFTKENVALVDTTCQKSTRLYKDKYKTDGEYPVDPANTVCHAFTVDYDFVSSIEYKVTDKDISFTHHIINEITKGEQETPAVAMSRYTRDFVAVWADDAYDQDSDSAIDTDGTGNHDIRARVACKTGCPKVPQFTVNTTTTGNQHTPDVAMNRDGDFVIVWTNDEDNSVYMRKFSLNGSELVAETKVNTSGNADKATVAIADNGSYVVTWQSSDNTADKNMDIFMRGFDAEGKEMFAQTNVSDATMNPNGKRSLPDIGMDKEGNFVITWEDDSDGNDGYNLRARGFDKNGSERIKEFLVNTNLDNDQRNPSIAMNSEGAFTIAWEDNSKDKKVYRILARGFNKDGSERFADKLLSPNSTNAKAPSICMTDHGMTYFTWATQDFLDSDGKIKNHVNIRSYLNENETSEDKKWIAESRINKAYYFGVQDQPTIACSDTNQTVILWHYKKATKTNYEIMGKGFND